MVYSPNMSKAFEGSYKTSKSRGAVVFAIEQVSTKDEKNIQPGQKFVIAELTILSFCPLIVYKSILRESFARCWRYV